MNPRQQAPLAPFVNRNSGCESSAQREALGLECRECTGDLPCRSTERCRESRLRDRTETFEAAAHDLDQGLIADPFSLRRAVRRRDCGIELCGWPDGTKLGQALGRNPQWMRWSRELRRALVLRKLGQ